MEVLVGLQRNLSEAAKQLATQLREQNLKIAFAESCTAGLAASSMSQIPGISDYLCGSAVTYQDASKEKWLGVNRADLDNPDITAVSETVACQMCEGLLRITPHADVVASVTGHLGPDAPIALDGTVYCGIQIRSKQPIVFSLQLTNEPLGDLSLRVTRHLEVATRMLTTIATFLRKGADGES